MKLRILFLCTVLLLPTCALNLMGCKASQQQVAYNTIYSVQKATVASYDAYLSLVIQGKVATNDVPRVSKAFNVFQASSLVAMDGVQFNTNALAPASLVTEANDVINLITIAKKGVK